jgi:hypothetical protein
MENLKLSKNFSLAEAVRSDTAERLHIINKPLGTVLNTMIQTALYMEEVRNILGANPIHINSWYRCIELNRAIGSKDTSQHRVGEAVDFVCPNFGTPLDICKEIIKHKDTIPFDQLIIEHSWVHISFSILNRKPRNQVISLLNTGRYAVGLTNAKGVPYK